MEKEQIRALGAYEIIREEELPDIQAKGTVLRHKKSGARILILPCEDNNKVFNIAFRTPPLDSTGAAHIVEHTVLCGSEHYPLKDPFVELVKGSLNTFLNAITYPDKTMYPVASTNDADFRNLMHVYLDAVFYPNIYHEENIFRQEGWHYELKSPDEPITLNGVVYSEMKGAFSSDEDVLERESMNSLFPDTAYGLESGGDPAVIPTLTYGKFLDFHRRYYHPSNSYIYLYGDMDMADTLDFIDREYLSGFDAAEIDSGLRFQKPFEHEKVIEKEYPVPADEDTAGKAFLSYNIVTGDPLDMCDILALQVLDYALLNAPGAPVKQALLDAGIGVDIDGGFSDGTLQPYFTIIAKYAEAEDADRFREIIRDTLKAQVKEGLNKKSIRAALSNAEFSYREADFGQYPKGLFYCLDIMDTWLYDDDAPFVCLNQLQAFRKLGELAETDYFEKLTEERLLNNTHSSLVILKPKPGLAEEREQAIADGLAAKKAAMSDEEIRQLINETEKLRAWQDQEETEEALATLPVLKRSDIRREVTEHENVECTVPFTLEDGSVVNMPAVWHGAETNGIGYLQLFFNEKIVEEEEIPYLGLLRAMLTFVSTKSYTYPELSNEIYSETGGIACSNTTVDVEGEADAYRAFFEIRTKALASKFVRGAALIYEILNTSDFTDEKRIREIISSTRAQLSMTLQQSGHMAASARAAAYTSSASAFTDMISGIAFYRFVRDLEENFDEKKNEVTAHLQALVTRMFRPDNVIISLTCGKDERDALLQSVCGCLDRAVPAEPLPGKEFELKPYGILNEAFTTAGQVQFVAMAGNIRKSGMEYNGSMAVFRQIMSYEYLWQNVRVRGGAYGCSANIGRNGKGMFLSYRDPHLMRTKKVFEEAPEYLRSFDADEETMTKYVIGTFSGIDIPLTPSIYGTVCMREYLSGIRKDIRQNFRLEVLNTTAWDIRALADAVEAVLADNCLCVIGSESMVAKYSDAFGSVTPLL